MTILSFTTSVFVAVLVVQDHGHKQEHEQAPAHESAPAQEEKHESSQASQETTPIQIEVESSNSGTLYSVEARYIRLGDFLEEFSKKSGLKFEGLEPGFANTTIDLSFTRRKLDEILKPTFGSAELRYTRTGNVVTLAAIPTTDSEEGKKWVFTAGIQASYEASRKFPHFPDTTKLFLLIASIDEQEGRIEEANQRYQAIIKNFRNSDDVPEALLRLGRNQIKAGNYEVAYGYLSNLVNDFVSFNQLDEGYYLFGRSLLQLGSVDRAGKYFGFMVEQYPNSPFLLMAKLYLAECMRRQGSAKEALELVLPYEEEAKKKAASRQEFLWVYGNCLFDLKEYKKAAATLFRFAGEFSNREEAPRANFRAAEAAYHNGDYLAAIFLLEKTRGEESIDSKAWNQLADQVRRSTHLEEFLELDDPGAEAISRAASLQQLGKKEEAIAMLREHFGSRRYGGEAKLEAARYLLENKASDQCIKWLLEWLPTANDPKWVDQAFQLLGDAYLQQGKTEQAAEAYQGILRRSS